MSRPVSRRTALIGTLGSVGAAVLLTGCQPFWEDADTPDDDAGTPGAPTATADPDADARAVEGVVAALAATHRLVRRTLDRHPDLEALEPFVRLHVRHLTELDAAVRPRGRTPRVSDDASRARAAVLTAEAALQTRLTSAAVDVASGVLAATLASMAAAVAQRVASTSGGTA